MQPRQITVQASFFDPELLAILRHPHIARDDAGGTILATSDSPSTEALAVPVSRYLRLLRRCLCRILFPDGQYDRQLNSMQRLPFDPALREDGSDWPTDAETMVGMKRLENLQDACLSVIREGVPGNFVETGVWRGGCGILMRAVLAATGDETRSVWLFDSFEGLPKPDPQRFPWDEGDMHWAYAYLAVSLDQVKANFKRYDLLDERTHFVPGWFRKTIHKSEVDAISVLRLDGDMYESTRLVLTHLYPRVSPGGFIIIDDYEALVGCKKAVDEFRERYSIVSPMNIIDWTGVFWRK